MYIPHINEGTLRKLKTDFKIVEESNYFGFIHKDYEQKISIEDIVKFGNQKNKGSDWNTQNVHIKKLGAFETDVFPSIRFMNNLSINQIFERKRYAKCTTPKAAGLIYSNTWHDIPYRNNEGYVISEEIKGKRAYDSIEHMDSEQKDYYFKKLSNGLDELRGFEIYLMEFAPRDIIIEENRVLRFLDTEIVDFAYDNEEQKTFLEKQKKIFKKEYQPFLTKEEFNKFEYYLFR